MKESNQMIEETKERSGASAAEKYLSDPEFEAITDTTLQFKPDMSK